MGYLCLLHQPHHALCLSDVAGKRFFAGDSLQGHGAPGCRGHDLFHILDACVIRPQQPDGFDAGIGNHFNNGWPRRSLADIERTRERSGFSGMFAVGAPYTADLGVTHRYKRLKVKAGDKSAAYNSNSQHIFAHKTSYLDSDFMLSPRSFAAGRRTA
jgi:hypothetical protein